MTVTDRKKAILVVSFGTSYEDTRDKTIGAIEEQIRTSFPEFEIRRAFTSRVIIHILKDRDGLEIDYVDQAVGKLLEEGYTDLIVQPTHVMSGIEYDEMAAAIEPYKNQFHTFAMGSPLLTDEDDYKTVVGILAEETKQYASDQTAIVFMGHGTDHEANEDYTRLDWHFKTAGYPNCIVGTVEAKPGLEDVIAAAGEIGAKKAVLIPFMIVAGDHANHDMAGGGEDSWRSAFIKEGYEVECVLRGLGEYEGIRNLFVKHAQEAVNSVK